jgi:hypothetical protein
MMTNPKRSTLTEQQISDYHQNGYITPTTRLPEAVHARLVESYHRLLSENPSMNTDFIPAVHIPGYTPDKIDHQTWLDFAAVPEVLDVVSDLIGPNFLMWGSSVFGKPALNGKETPMHQDGEYWPIRPLASVTVWFAIDASTKANGCLRVIPGSHRNKQLYKHRRDDDEQYTLNQVLNDERLDRAAAPVDIELEPGQFSVHDIYLVHGSHPNTSDRRRASLSFRYMPTTSHFDHEWAGEMARTMGVTDMSDRTLYLVRGNDQSGLNDFSRGSRTRLPLPQDRS